MDPNELFEREVATNIAKLSDNESIRRKSLEWLGDITALRYAYNFRWLGRPIIQVPQDVFAMQEIIWKTRPDLIIETGIAHGGSLIFSASMLALLDYCDAVENGCALDPLASRRRVLGIDIDIRAHNRIAIESHRMAHLIQTIEGSSISPEVIAQVRDIANQHERILVILDSNHTHDHVLSELESYAPMTSPSSYCIVYDTVIEDLSDSLFTDRPWARGDNPKTAVWEYLRRLKLEGRRGIEGSDLHFEIDKSIEAKLLISVAPDGYLKRT